MDTGGNFALQQRNAVNTALNNSLGFIQDAVEQGKISIGEAKKLWDESRYDILLDFKKGEDAALAKFTADQRAADTELDAFRDLLWGDVDQTLAAEDFDFVNALRTGAAGETAGYLADLRDISGMSDQLLNQMGLGIFGGYEQDLVSQGRDMELAAKLGAEAELQDITEAAIASDQLAPFFGTTPAMLAAGLAAGIDIPGMRYGTSEREAEQAWRSDEAKLDRLAQGIDPVTGRPYGFDTTTGLTAGQQAQQKQFDVANLINPATGMPYGFDTGTGLTAAEAANLAAAEARAAVEDARWRTQTIDDRYYQDELLKMQEEELALAQAAQDADILAQEAATAQGWAALDEAGGVDVLQTVFDITSASQADYADAWYDLTARIEDLNLPGGVTSDNIGRVIPQLIGDPALDQNKRDYWQDVATALDTSIDSVGVGGGGADTAIIAEILGINPNTGEKSRPQPEDASGLEDLFEAGFRVQVNPTTGKSELVDTTIDPTKFQEAGDFSFPGAPDPNLPSLEGIGEFLVEDIGLGKKQVRIPETGNKTYPPEAWANTTAIKYTNPDATGPGSIKYYLSSMYNNGWRWDATRGSKGDWVKRR